MKKQKEKVFPCCWNCGNGFEAICETKDATEKFRASKRICCASRPVSQTAENPFKERHCSQFQPHTFGPRFKRNIDGEEAAVLQYLTPGELQDYWSHDGEHISLDLDMTFPLKESAAGRMALGRMLLSLDASGGSVLSVDMEGHQIALMPYQAAMIYAIEHGALDDGTKAEETVVCVVQGKADRTGVRPAPVECYLSITNDDVVRANEEYAKRVGQPIRVDGLMRYGEELSKITPRNILEDIQSNKISKIEPTLRTFRLPHQRFKCQRPEMIFEAIYHGVNGLKFGGEMPTPWC